MFSSALSEAKQNHVIKQNKQNKMHIGKPSKGGHIMIPEEKCKHRMQRESQLREASLGSTASGSKVSGSISTVLRAAR